VKWWVTTELKKVDFLLGSLRSCHLFVSWQTGERIIIEGRCAYFGRCALIVEGWRYPAGARCKVNEGQTRFD